MISLMVTMPRALCVTALVIALGQRAGAQPATPAQPRRVLFDDVDVPDFLKNGA